MEIEIMLLAAAALIAFLVYIIKEKQYKKTVYYHQTQNHYLKVLFDKGRLGEYYTFTYLKGLKGHKKFLFNVYLPKENGETTEVDVILLHDSGIYVFESKNYSGWIFGTETQQYWTQTLPVGKGKSKKSKFFNPILQNKVHLKWLQQFLGKERELPFYSYIIFSDRCTLKNITLTSGNHFVINRYDILKAVRKNAAHVGTQLTEEEIDALYEKLYPLTQVDEAQKLAHIEDVKQKQQAAASHKTGVKAKAKEPVQEAEQQPEKEAEKQPEEKTTKTEPVQENRCPRCGGELVVRTVKKGEHKGKKFLGCSNYPKCRYIKDIPEEPGKENDDLNG